MKRKPLNTSDDADEEFSLENDHYKELNFNKFDRSEGGISESIEDELNLDGVMRELVDFDEALEELVDDTFNDALGG